MSTGARSILRQSDSHPSFFLLTPTNYASVQTFFGYAFVGRDYIYGSDGSAAYFKESGVRIQPGGDGCYIAVDRSGASLRIGTDGTGLARIYYYQDDTYWAIAGSFHRLVNHLRSVGIHLTPNYPQLAAFAPASQFTNQQAAFETIVMGVRLLATGNVLKLAGGKITVEPRVSILPRRNYEATLKTFIETWLGRVRTLVSSPDVTVTADLTGGVDSRTVYALLQRASETVGNSRIFYRTHTADRWAADREVARRIAQHDGVRLNRRTASLPQAIDGGSAYATWRAVSLGVYLPVYFPYSAPDSRRVHFHGGGGESFRKNYGDQSLNDYLERYRKKVPTHFFTEWAHQVQSSISAVQRLSGELDPLIVHYREFRNRLHSGRSPLYFTVAAPLSSADLSQTDRPPSFFANRQLHFDIMENLAPGLMEMPYDSASKAPSHDNRSAITRVDYDPDIEPGRAFLDPPYTAVVEDSPPPVEHMASEFSSALRSDAVRSFVGTELARRAETEFDAAHANGRFSHANDGRDVSFMMAAALAFGAI